MSHEITREDLRTRLAAGEALTLVEALPPRYWEDAHLPGAINLPHDAVTVEAARRLPARDAEIVVYCASDTCRNSDMAAAALEAQGYSRVSVYKGGKKDWIEAGLPVEAARPA